MQQKHDRESEWQTFVDQAYELTKIVLGEEESATDIRLILEIFSHLTGSYSIALPLKVIESIKTEVEVEDINWFLDRPHQWNFTVSGGVYHAWKRGTISEKRAEELLIKIPKGFEKNFDDLWDCSTDFIMKLCNANYGSTEGDFIVNCIFKKQEIISHDELRSIDLEEKIVHGGGEVNKYDKYHLYIVPLIQDGLYLGLGYFSVNCEDKSKKVVKEIKKLEKLLQNFVVPNLAKEQMSRAIEIPEWRTELAENGDFESYARNILKSAFHLPLVEEDYPKGYTDEMVEWEVEYNKYKFNFWVPEWFISNEKLKDCTKKRLVNDYLNPIQEIEKDFSTAREHAKIRADNDKERSIAHMQKSLYNSLALKLNEYISQTYIKKSKTPPINLIRSESIAYFISFSNLMRQKGNFNFDSKKSEVDSAFYFEYPIIYFIKCIYLITFVMIDNEDTIKYETSRDLIESINKFVDSIIKENDDIYIEDAFHKLYSDVESDMLAKSLIESNLDFHTLEEINIRIPSSNKSIFFPLFLCFFELFSNINRHAWRFKKTDVLFKVNNNEQYIIFSSSNDGETPQETLSIIDFYKSKEKYQNKCVLRIIDENILSLFSSHLRVAVREPKGGRDQGGFASYILFSDKLFTVGRNNETI
ncbi:hypothetical protein H6F42_20415 [Pseudanabaena sp. FACHB-1998]|uniref:hypothetical protein n=1 Tax=Pseudanabaena sp. FACHB-1998 TaxID=2692858 RepID=UPI001680A0D2|nr:hypothetical protein [Pseudanabaena sp. FACHB-1998]MBD2179291.1 hypothetical protein [Pseudanabaena sp. FACHB-1998]